MKINSIIKYSGFFLIVFVFNIFSQCMNIIGSKNSIITSSPIN